MYRAAVWAWTWSGNSCRSCAGASTSSRGPGKEQRSLLRLPLTLAMIDGLVVGVGGERYIVPIFAVREMLRPPEESVSPWKAGRKWRWCATAAAAGAAASAVRSGASARNWRRESLLIVSEAAAKQFCLMVDELIGKQEVVIKSLGETMNDIAGVAGGAILGDGRVGLILDLEGLFGASHRRRIGRGGGGCLRSAKMSKSCSRSANSARSANWPTSGSAWN